MWQSLSYGANYKAAYCLAVCPAGEDVIGPFLADRKTHLKEIVRPLQEKEETIYVAENSDAEDHVAKRFPHKKIKLVGNSLRPNSIKVFLNGMPNVFQPGKSAGLNATFHFTFTGDEQRQATVVIQKQKLSVKEGHVGQPDLHVTADSQTWIGFLRKGNKRGVGTAAAEDSAQWPTQAAGGVRKVLSAVAEFHTIEVPPENVLQKSSINVLSP